MLHSSFIVREEKIKSKNNIACPCCGGSGFIPKDGSEWRKARVGAGASQADVAALLGVSAQYIGELERGTRRLTYDLRTKIAEAIQKIAEENREGD